MTLSAGGSVGGGDYLDFKELAQDGPVVAVFRIREFSPAEDMSFGTVVPVVADVLVCDGERAGSVYLSERIIGAPTGPLRGVKNPRGVTREVAAPTNQVGQELVFRVETVERRGAQPFVGLQEPSASDMATAERVHDGGNGWNASPSKTDEPEMAGAVGANGMRKPFG